MEGRMAERNQGETRGQIEGGYCTGGKCNGAFSWPYVGNSHTKLKEY